jgi:hypothetical protein
MVSEVLIHVPLAPLLCAYGEAENHCVRSRWQMRLLTHGRQETERKEHSGDKILPSKAHSQ